MSAYTWVHTLHGNVIGEIRRFRKADGKKDDIPFYTRNGRSFKAGIPLSMKPLPPFGIDSVIDPTKPVIICEGQKKQAAWAYLGFQALSGVGGAMNGKSHQWDRLKDCKIIWFAPDNDVINKAGIVAGDRYIRDIWSCVREFGAEMAIIRLPNLPVKGDVCDWLKQQPALAEWNELDPLTDHPQREQIAAQLLTTVKANLHDIPEDWEVEVSWPDPEPIESRLLPVEAITADMLPKALRAWIEDSAFRIEVPIDYVAVGAIVAAGSAIGTRCGIRPRTKDEWTVTPNTWGVVIGPPGDGKSPALRESIFALESLEMQAAETAGQAQKEYEAKLSAYEAREKAIKDEMNKAAKSGASNTDMAMYEEKLCELEAPERPNAARFVANDTTVEALISLLRDNQRGLLMFQDELASLLESWEKQGHETDRSFFLQCWTGNGKHRQDRISRGSVVAEKLCLSILGGIQEDMLRGYLSGIAATKNDGLIQRFQLMIYPDPRPVNMEDIDVAADKEAKHRAFAVFRELASMKFEEYGAKVENGQCYFRFDDEAQELYREWLIDLKQRMAAEEEPMMREHLSKYRSLMPSLALIFHLIEMVAHTRHGDVPRECARLAAAWCGYLEDHARRVYGLLKAKEESAAAVVAEKIVQGRLKERFTARQVMQKHWRMLNRKELVEPALTVLVEAGWLQKSITQTGGHPRIEYTVNPKICNGHNVLNVCTPLKGIGIV